MAVEDSSPSHSAAEDSRNGRGRLKMDVEDSSPPQPFDECIPFRKV